MSEHKILDSKWIFLFKWMLVTIVASIFIFTLGFEAYHGYIYRKIGHLPEVIFLISGGIGGIIGIAQWLVLRRQISRAGWWVVMNIIGSALGMIIGLVVGLGIVFFTHGALSTNSFVLVATFTASLILAGTMLVIGWFAWRRQLHHFRWFAMVTVMWMAAAIMSVFTGKLAYDALFDLGLVITGAAFGAVFGVVYGFITGGAWNWLLSVTDHTP